MRILHLVADQIGFYLGNEKGTRTVVFKPLSHKRSCPRPLLFSPFILLPAVAHYSRPTCTASLVTSTGMRLERANDPAHLPGRGYPQPTETTGQLWKACQPAGSGAADDSASIPSQFSRDSCPTTQGILYRVREIPLAQAAVLALVTRVTLVGGEVLADIGPGLDCQEVGAWI